MFAAALQALHHRNQPHWRIALVVVLPCVLLNACTSSQSQRIAAENDRLRNLAEELQGKVKTIESRNTELQAELKAASIVSTSLPEEIRAVTPHVAEVSISGLTNARDANADGRPDLLLAYLHPTDGLGRFIQLVGPVSMTAVLVPPNADAITIGRKNFTPAEVRDSYRSFITGVHYSFEMPLQLPPQMPANVKEAMVQATYIDGVTGQTFTAQRSVSLDR